VGLESLLMFAGFILALLAFLSTGVPVAVGMGLIAALGLYFFQSPAAWNHLGNLAIGSSTNFALIVVPLFLLMGDLIARSPLSRQLFQAAQTWVGRVPGALAISTIFGSMGFAAISGSSPVTAATIGSVAIPEMEREGYNRSLAFGAVAAGGTLGILIPPSIVLILYGIITETSIGALFVAAVIPGVLTTLLLVATVLVLVLRNPDYAPRVEVRSSWMERFQSTRSLFPVLLLFGLVMGAIYLGIATPSESAAVGAVAAFVIVMVIGRMSRSQLFGALSSTAQTSAMFMLLVISGLFVAFMLSLLGIPQGLAGFLLGLDVSPWVVLIAINLLLILMGMFMDPLSVLVIMVPLLAPAVIALGYDPIWFGVMFTLNIEIGMVTPPVGLNLFVLKSVVPDAGFGEIIRGSIWFITPLLLGLALLIAFPQLALMLL
jgi:C4-dicarboxylate transporter, DctM subunit